jgi:hypothetical protein
MAEVAVPMRWKQCAYHRSDAHLAALSNTLNQMLGRIEAGYQSVRSFTANAAHELRSPVALLWCLCVCFSTNTNSVDSLTDRTTTFAPSPYPPG